MKVAPRALVSALALGLAVLTGSLPALAQALLPPGESAYVLGTGGAGAKVRTGPGLSYEVQGGVAEGTLVQVITGPQNDGDLNWYQIRSTDGAGVTARGWMAAPFLVAKASVATRADGSLGTRDFMGKIAAYISGDGIGWMTATGSRVRWGTAAVDPRFVPLGSLMTIDGLEGVFSAEDTGGSVRGEVVDVWFPDRAAAMTWGTRTKKVTVLREGY